MYINTGAALSISFNSPCRRDPWIGENSQAKSIFTAILVFKTPAVRI